MQLNEGSLWSGGPQDSDNPEALAALPEIRRLLFEGKYAEAKALTNKKLKCKGPGTRGRPLRLVPNTGRFDAEIRRPRARPTNIAASWTSISAVVRSMLSSGRCSLYPRSIFQSGRSGIGRAPKLRQAGQNQFHGHSYPARTLHTRPQGPDGLVMSGQLNGGQDGDSGMKYVARVKAICEGGKFSTDGDTLRVEGADTQRSCLPLARIINSKPPDYRGDPPEPKTAAQLAAAAEKPYADLLKSHLADYKNFSAAWIWI